MTRAARGRLLVDIRHVTGKIQALLESRRKLAVKHVGSYYCCV